MRSKERVLTTFAREEPDRVPVDYFANAGIDGRLKRHFGLRAGRRRGAATGAGHRLSRGERALCRSQAARRLCPAAMWTSGASIACGSSIRPAATGTSSIFRSRRRRWRRSRPGPCLRRTTSTIRRSRRSAGSMASTPSTWAIPGWPIASTAPAFCAPWSRC